MSGYKKPLGERRQGKRLLADAKTGKLKDTVLIVYKHARLGRKMLDTLQAVADLANNGVTIYDASTHEEIDNSSSKGKLLLGFKSLVAEYERDTDVESMRDGLERLAREGKLMPRYPRLGYEWSEVDENGHKTPGAKLRIKEDE